MKLIGLTGGMGCGKSTAVNILKAKYGTGNVHLVKFAQPLYDMQEYIYRRIHSVHKRNPNFIKDRLLLQFLGTEWGRKTISETLWGDIWQAEVLRNTDKAIIVADDVRYDNEALRVKSMGGIVIEILCNDPSSRIDTNSGISVHASENGVNPDLIEYAINNSCSIEEFKIMVLRTISIALSEKIS